jgi:plasmid maintenance system antidote protein VapI
MEKIDNSGECHIDFKNTITIAELKVYAHALGVSQARLNELCLTRANLTNLNKINKMAERLNLSTEELKNIEGEYANGYILGK